MNALSEKLQYSCVCVCVRVRARVCDTWNHKLFFGRI